MARTHTCRADFHVASGPSVWCFRRPPRDHRSSQGVEVVCCTAQHVSRMSLGQGVTEAVFVGRDPVRQAGKLVSWLKSTRRGE